MVGLGILGCLRAALDFVTLRLDRQHDAIITIEDVKACSFSSDI